MGVIAEEQRVRASMAEQLSYPAPPQTHQAERAPVSTVEACPQPPPHDARPGPGPTTAR